MERCEKGNFWGRKELELLAAFDWAKFPEQDRAARPGEKA